MFKLFKDVYHTTKEVCKVYDEEGQVPKFISFPYWYTVLLITLGYRMIFKRNKEDV